MLADVFINGLVGFYTQNMWLMWEEAERLELIYRRQFVRKFGLARGTARLQMYVRRTHSWAVGAAAFFTHTTRCATEVEDVGKRWVMRSAIARAAARWGCREDPMQWDASHIREALQKHVQSSRVRDVGEAWWLANLVLRENEDEGGGTAKLRSLQELPAGDPFHPESAHFTAPGTNTILVTGGMPFELPLAEAGLVAIGHWCRWEPAAGSQRTPVFMDSFDEAVRLQGALAGVEGI